ncbi:hypothetical protein CJ194_04030 [Priestia megaterium]|nr:hypothetical protein COI96_03445 [Priestia megaterium]PMD10659.1 hypothetical protein CJ194_04030 [Priestia megaterium]
MFKGIGFYFLLNIILVPFYLLLGVIALMGLAGSQSNELPIMVFIVTVFMYILGSIPSVVLYRYLKKRNFPNSISVFKVERVIIFVVSIILMYYFVFFF